MSDFQTLLTFFFSFPTVYFPHPHNKFSKFYLQVIINFEFQKKKKKTFLMQFYYIFEYNNEVLRTFEFYC